MARIDSWRSIVDIFTNKKKKSFEMEGKMLSMRGGVSYFFKISVESLGIFISFFIASRKLLKLLITLAVFYAFNKL